LTGPLTLLPGHPRPPRRRHLHRASGWERGGRPQRRPGGDGGAGGTLAAENARWKTWSGESSG